MTIQETQLPPGFRFHPTDEELILHYLRKRAASLPCPVSIIAEVDIYKFNPWDLPERVVFLQPEGPEVPQRDEAQQGGGVGYWKATGTDKVIVAPPHGNESIGVKKALVFYKGRPPKGMKTSWIMHEYRLTQTAATTAAHNRPVKPTREDRPFGFCHHMLTLFIFFCPDYTVGRLVLCRIYNKGNNLPATSADHAYEDSNLENAYVPPQETGAASERLPKCLSFGDLLEESDYSLLARMLGDNPTHVSVPDADPLMGYENPNENHLSYGGHGGAMSIPPSKSTPPMDSPAPEVGICLKRERTAAGFEEEGDYFSCPGKRSTSSSHTCYNNFTGQPGITAPHYGSVSSAFQLQQTLFNSQIGHQLAPAGQGSRFGL
ncbi:unnamed protein product [Spirodela intermedia]|uniref:NAC domain-containing protein n=1 Tax=Spirodela intermedia TaxID=51605 RepID=A0A7I8IHY5_SPIIN|nr:unnamed protein product [Spirodela intermedia]CAA6656986.1 unnamed protein product [Spirodela intermedia]